MILCKVVLLVVSIVGITGEDKCIEIIENSWIKIDDVVIKNSTLLSYPVCASFVNQINQTGWSYLTIWSDPSTDLNDSTIAYLAGYLEGYMTRELIDDHFDNAWRTYCTDDPEFCEKAFQFYQDNLLYMKDNLYELASSDPYWHQVALVLSQMTGISDGMYGKLIYKPGINIDIHGKVFILNIITDLMELESVLKRGVNKKDQGFTTCSAMVKLVPGDLIIGHATWYEFGCMLRILKKYYLPFRTESKPNSPAVPGKLISMSSYPGLIFSSDDYYLISTGLTVMETTLMNFNETSYQFVKPDAGVLTFIRTMVANRLAVDGQSWSQIFSRYNLGTYNNQFMIVDYKRFTADKDEQESGLFWVLEQMPNLIVAQDMTSTLFKNNYWASYNIPYFKEVYQLADYPSSVKKYGPTYDYNENSRAKQFKRKQVEVFDYKSLLRLLRYNNYQNDPDARCNCTPPYSAGMSIASRADLNDPKGKYDATGVGFINEAAIDAKVTSFELFKQFKMYAISGPTYDDVPPFIWSNSILKDMFPHKGHPDAWVFEPIYF
ncbi:putative phospholipase B-like 2 [Tetranychus urticae]|uniref:Phospholipase B-like n=1 Tax=Tetranychus urticae TaxID=32264 RepID=T1K1P7_TETUR|nr:putative phospholipase B-like 2 [Tetranychus urticae]